MQYLAFDLSIYFHKSLSTEACVCVWVQLCKEVTPGRLVCHFLEENDSNWCYHFLQHHNDVSAERRLSLSYEVVFALRSGFNKRTQGKTRWAGVRKTPKQREWRETPLLVFSTGIQQINLKIYLHYYISHRTRKVINQKKKPRGSWKLWRSCRGLELRWEAVVNLILGQRFTSKQNNNTKQTETFISLSAHRW